jgi:hypothetical protein
MNNNSDQNILFGIIAQQENLLSEEQLTGTLKLCSEVMIQFKWYKLR